MFKIIFLENPPPYRAPPLIRGTGVWTFFIPTGLIMKARGIPAFAGHGAPGKNNK